MTHRNHAGVDDVIGESLSIYLGHIPVNDWCDIVTNVLDLRLPWRTLKARLVDIDSNGMVIYESTFRSRELQCALNSSLNHVKRLIMNLSFLSFELILETTKSLPSNLSK